MVKMLRKLCPLFKKPVSEDSQLDYNAILHHLGPLGRWQKVRTTIDPQWSIPVKAKSSIYSQFLRCVTARGSCVGLVTVSPAKV